MHRILSKNGYIFTDKKHPKWGIMSSILGLIATTSLCLAIHFTYLNGGTAPMQYGAVVLLAISYAIAGMILGIRSLTEKDIFRFFPICGIVLNSLAILGGCIIVFLGYY